MLSRSLLDAVGEIAIWPRTVRSYVEVAVCVAGP